MKVKVNLNGKELIKSGTVVLNSGQNEFDIFLEDLKFVFRFVYADVGEPSITIDSGGDKSAIVSLTNWSNPLGTSYVQPGIALINGKSVDLGWFVQGIGDEKAPSRAVSFSVYAEPTP